MTCAMRLVRVVGCALAAAAGAACGAGDAPADTRTHVAPDRAFARLSVDVKNEGPEGVVYIYVNDVHQGTWPLARPLVFDRGRYRVAAMLATSGFSYGAFVVAETPVDLDIGATQSVQLTLPDTMYMGFMGSASIPEPSGLVCTADSLREYAETFGRWAVAERQRVTDFAADTSVQQIIGLSQAFETSPPTTGSAVIRDVPLWSVEEGRAKSFTMTLQVTSPQIAHLASWLDEKQYLLGSMEGLMKEALKTLEARAQWAAGCGAPNVEAMVNPSYQQVGQTSAMITENRERLKAAAKSVTAALDEAAKSDPSR